MLVAWSNDKVFIWAWHLIVLPSVMTFQLAKKIGWLAMPISKCHAAGCTSLHGTSSRGNLCCLFTRNKYSLRQKYFPFTKDYCARYVSQLFWKFHFYLILILIYRNLVLLSNLIRFFLFYFFKHHKLSRLTLGVTASNNYVDKIVMWEWVFFPKKVLTHSLYNQLLWHTSVKKFYHDVWQQDRA